jgi:imidazolonepropionase
MVEKLARSILIRGACQLLTLRGGPGPRRGPELSDLAIIRDGALLVSDGVIQEVGPSRRVENLAKARDAIEISATGRVVMPGFVDSHTHLMAPPPGVPEDELRRAARLVRTSSARRLVSKTRVHVEAMARHGTTTVEGKTGCCMDLSAEVKLLRVLAALRNTPLDVLATVLLRLPRAGAVPHAMAEQMVDWMCRELLPKISKRRLAQFADVVLDDNPAHRHWFERLIAAAKTSGLGCKIHCGPGSAQTVMELVRSGDVVSIGHLESAPAEDVEALAGSQSVATLLPGFELHRTRAAATARSLIEAGVPIALASDFNPQYAPTLNMQTVVALGSMQLGLAAAEAISAATINGAHAAGCAGSIGSLELGKQADLVMLNISDYREMAGQLGSNLVRLTMKRGAFIYEEGEVAPVAAHELRIA